MKRDSIFILILVFLLNSCGSSQNDDTDMYKTKATPSIPYANAVGVSQNKKIKININKIPFYDKINELKFINNRYVCIADGYAGISIIDTKNNTIVSNYDTDGYAYAIEIKNNLIYIADGAEGIKIIKFQNPNEMYLINKVQTYYALDLAIKDNILYVADKSELKILNASNPYNIKTITNYEKNIDILKVDIVGNRAFIKDFNAHTQTMDITNPREPKLLN